MSARSPSMVNPCDGLKMPRVRACDRGPGMRAFSLAEVRALILHAETLEREQWQTRRHAPNRSVLYCFLAHTGLRYGEAMRLQVSDVDLPGAMLRVRADKAGRGDGRGGNWGAISHATPPRSWHALRATWRPSERE